MAMGHYDYLQILKTPSLNYLTKIKVWDIQILNTPSLNYPTKIKVWELKMLSPTSLNYPTSKKINKLKISSADQRKDLENEILNIINEHSKIKIQIPFRRDIRGEINTVNNRAIYSKQYPYALSASDFVNSEVSRVLKEEI